MTRGRSRSADGPARPSLLARPDRRRARHRRAPLGPGAPRNETLWLLGPAAAQSLRNGCPPLGAQRFDAGGVVVLRKGGDHVFVDCGAVGLAGRGGHGHNDCLSFEATLDGVDIVVDPGTYVYTASPVWRNRFRSTSAHNTPRIDGQEQARIDPDSLWRIAPDATGEILAVGESGTLLRFRGAHAGYERLPSPVRVTRSIDLDFDARRVEVLDEFEGNGEHDVCVPIQLGLGIKIRVFDPGRVVISTGSRAYELTWSDDAEWELGVGTGWVSRSYGRREQAPRLEWRRQGPLRPLRICLAASMDDVDADAPAESGATIG